MTGQIRIGVSGWRYAPWRGNFYPRKLAQARELEYASGQFSSIEINGSFYSLQRPSSYAQWAAATPPDFVFAVKGARYITHMLRLRNVEAALANFFASGPFEDDSGALIIYEADSEKQARALLEADPFRVAGVFQTFTMKPWRQVF